MSNEEIGIRVSLRNAIRSAMRERDRAAVSTYRTALAAIDNAEAIPLTDGDRAGAIEQASVGVASTEAARRDLTEVDQLALVSREVDELESAGHTARAQLLRNLL